MHRSELIAEIGQNHNGEMCLALEMIHATKECGADVAKFQVYDARKLFPREKNAWFEYNCKTELTRDQVSRLAEECQKVGIEFMASVFDTTRVDWLEEVGVRRHKVASRSIREAVLIEKLCQTRRPLIVSLGMWCEREFPKIPTNAPVEFLYCISKYPTPLEEVRFSRVDFTRYSGFSDHTVGISATMVALARGARVIEKHFTLDKTMYGPDHACSATPSELRQLHVFRQELARLL